MPEGRGNSLLRKSWGWFMGYVSLGRLGALLQGLQRWDTVGRAEGSVVYRLSFGGTALHETLVSRESRLKPELKL